MFCAVDKTPGYRIANKASVSQFREHRICCDLENTLTELILLGVSEIGKERIIMFKRSRMEAIWFNLMDNNN